MIYDEKPFEAKLPDIRIVMQQLLDAIPIPAFIRDTEGVLLMENQAFCLLMSCGSMDIRGKRISDFLDPGQASHFERHDQDMLSDRAAHSYEARIRTATGFSRDYAFQKSLLFDEKKEVVGLFCSMLDLTEQRAAERRMKEAMEQTVIASAMLHKIKAGVVIADADLKVIDANLGFARLMGGDLEELYETVPGLAGAELKELVPEAVYRMFSSLMNSGEPMAERDLRYQNKLLHVSAISIYKNRVVGALIRDMSAPSLVREEIVSRAQRVNKQNMETVQKIAFLLGENASVMEELLHSIIASYSYGEEDEA
ncbi:MAG: PAS domain-containing protein [Mangrovibacterium sp.]